MNANLRCLRCLLLSLGIVLISLSSAYAQAIYKAKAVGFLQILTPLQRRVFTFFPIRGNGQADILSQSGKGESLKNRYDPVILSRRFVTAYSVTEGISSPLNAAAAQGYIESDAHTTGTGFFLFNLSDDPITVACRFSYILQGSTEAFGQRGIDNRTNDAADFFVTLIRENEFHTLFHRLGVATSANGENDAFDHKRTMPFSLDLPADSETELVFSTHVSGKASTEMLPAPEASTVLSFGVMLALGGLAYRRRQRRRQPA